MNEEERELLIDIFENTEAPEKIKIILDPRTRDVTIVYEDCDDEWFRELQAAQQSVQANPPPAPKLSRAYMKNEDGTISFPAESAGI